jgi:hypothetical protein
LVRHRPHRCGESPIQVRQKDFGNKPVAFGGRLLIGVSPRMMILDN